LADYFFHAPRLNSLHAGGTLIGVAIAIPWKVAAMKKIELCGSSEQSWEDATRRAVTQAVRTAGPCKSVQVKRFEATVTDGEVSQFCVWIEVLEAIVSGGLSRPARILVADDLEPIQKVARFMLEGAGHEVDAASDGAEAFARVQAKPYDLVLMDIEMPIMDGIASTKAIRALASSESAVPILAMTVNVLPEHVRTYLAAGMSDYVAKPLNQGDFLRKLSEWLPGTRAAEQPANLPEPPAPFFDQQAFESLRTMMGSERVSEWIAKFLHRLEATFPVVAEETSDRELLARDAHALVSYAALLGFPELSLLCSELEGACVGGEDVGPLILRVRAAARAAESQAREISPLRV
jgi:CheY-like chemotaxis protein/HPt (histidine-containing phosphotransfer) domain-containing protein/flavin-binding protein dodecin